MIYLSLSRFILFAIGCDSCSWAENEKGAEPDATDNDPQLPVFDYLYTMRHHQEYCAGRV